ncbi:LytTR family DNA-binding domain-containing protein [Polaribacter sp. Q13]|uniref:LytR/AlgR family response regulator transcription factor n=1 Tax=Polaribacter sp. Q13 TaxID=2806551 RepID=UPI00193B0049|nr:LytTR family DNA-binding domain-containing protein [Polaribacter sp. Q13]QVY67209.1 response regulator transcription factor [Polaribacter sp. Q13]
MDTINAIIIDDEINARENLRYLLNEFCKNITVISEAKNVDEAVLKIKKHKPQLIFLDIEMPQKNGFQLLNSFTEIDFQIIFVTAYDKYAVKAFEVAALDYLLKPIEIEKLVKSIKRATTSIVNKTNNNRITLLKENKKTVKKIAIPYKSDYVILNITDLLYIEADRMYSIIHTKGDKKYLASKKLSYYENLLCDENIFIRVHRSWIINSNKIVSYSKKDKMITLDSHFKIPVSKSYKETFEKMFSS